MHIRVIKVSPIFIGKVEVFISNVDERIVFVV